MSTPTDRANPRHGGAVERQPRLQPRVNAFQAIPFAKARDTLDQFTADDPTTRMAWLRVQHELRALSEMLNTARVDLIDAEDRARASFPPEYVAKLRAESARWRTECRHLEDRVAQLEAGDA